MSPRARAAARWGGFLALVAGVVLYAAGAFEGARIRPGRLPAPAGLPAPTATAVAARGIVPVVEEAVGTVRSRRRVAVSAQVTARIVQVAAEVGDAVRAGAPLVVLDDSDFAARYAQARAQYERVRGFLARHAATTEQMEAAEAAYLEAKAAVAHTRIAAPIDGIVAERHAEPGDLAAPGLPLLVVLDPTALRLEAQVREGIIGRIVPDTRLAVELPAVGAAIEGTVAEILPSADPQSRTFEVRVNFEPVTGVHPGMFGRLRLPVGEREVVHVPAAAIERVGQLETVVVESGGRWTRRLVTTGAALAGGEVEVLSGLAGGETVGLAAP
ncbi:MAG TPA: efflux RND transporter periplasmic adaptor subunit [Candidatus Binatia bacterium]|nr:efflux RND transporter periplasmic adaptor subunit [Candidatus Binatia bacterium]